MSKSIVCKNHDCTEQQACHSRSASTATSCCWVFDIGWAIQLPSLVDGLTAKLYHPTLFNVHCLLHCLPSAHQMLMFVQLRYCAETGLGLLVFSCHQGNASPGEVCSSLPKVKRQTGAAAAIWLTAQCRSASTGHMPSVHYNQQRPLQSWLPASVSLTWQLSAQYCKLPTPWASAGALRLSSLPSHTAWQQEAQSRMQLSQMRTQRFSIPLGKEAQNRATSTFCLHI